MKRLNPIYILVLIVTILLVSFNYLNTQKNEFNSLEKEAQSFINKAKNYSEYKQTWFDKTKVEKKIDSILKSSLFKNEKILRTQSKNIIKFKIESDNPKTLEKFINRILNEKVLIKKIDIEKNSLSFEVETK